MGIELSEAAKLMGFVAYAPWCYVLQKACSIAAGLTKICFGTIMYLKEVKGVLSFRGRLSPGPAWRGLFPADKG